jgi:hypothetical protein
VVAIRRVKRFSFFLFSSEAPTYLNSDRVEKLRVDEWLISAILREIKHLGRSEWSGRVKRTAQRLIQTTNRSRLLARDFVCARSGVLIRKGRD